MIDFFLNKINEYDWNFSNLIPKVSLQSLFDTAKKEAGSSLKCFESEKYKKELQGRIKILACEKGPIKFLIALKEILYIASFYQLSKDEIYVIYQYLSLLDSNRKNLLHEMWLQSCQNASSFEESFLQAFKKEETKLRDEIIQKIHEFLIVDDSSKVYLTLQLNITNLRMKPEYIEELLRRLIPHKDGQDALFIRTQVAQFYDQCLKSGCMSSKIGSELKSFLSDSSNLL